MANDEIYDVEDMDMDADIQRKQELIEEIKSLDLETDGAAALRAVNDMKRRWNRITTGNPITKTACGMNSKAMWTKCMQNATSSTRLPRLRRKT